MQFEIKPQSNTPIYQQLRDQIILGIATGELAVGELLPSVRQLAEEIGINTMTISKAYNSLKEDGLLITDRRKGTAVAAPRSFTFRRRILSTTAAAASSLCIDSRKKRSSDHCRYSAMFRTVF